MITKWGIRRTEVSKGGVYLITRYTDSSTRSQILLYVLDEEDTLLVGYATT